MKLLRNTKNKVNKDKNGENVPRLEINELVLVQCNIFKKVYQDSRANIHLCLIMWSIIRYFTQKFVFLKTFDSEFLYVRYVLLIKILNC